MPNISLKSTTNLANANIYGQLKIRSPIIILNAQDTSTEISDDELTGIIIEDETSSTFKIVYNKTTKQLQIGESDSLKNVATEEYVDTSSNTMKEYVDSLTNAIKESMITKSDVSNEADKIPKYSSEGHLVLPSGVELY